MEGSLGKTLQEASDELVTVGEYGTPTDMKIRGARPVFNKKVFSSDRSIDDLDRLELNPQQKLSEIVCEVLNSWAANNSMSGYVNILMSEHLPIHLNLPVKTYPANCRLFQALVLRTHLPFTLLTLYAGESVDSIPSPSDVRQFSTRCARVLTSELRNFCGKDFILLPCTLQKEYFSLDTLQEELQQQERLVAEVYGGPLRLTEEMRQKLAEAVLILATASDAPSFFDGSKKPGQTLLKGSADSDRFLRQTISHLLTTDDTETPPTISYRETTLALPMVLEAAKRLSYSQRVIIVIQNGEVKKCAESLGRYAKREHGLEPFRCLTVDEARQELLKESSVNAPPETTEVQDETHAPAGPDNTAQRMTTPTDEGAINVKTQENDPVMEDDFEPESGENLRDRTTSTKSVPANEDQDQSSNAKYTKLSAEEERPLSSDDVRSLSDPVPHRSRETAPPVPNLTRAAQDQAAQGVTTPNLSESAIGLPRPMDQNPLIIALDSPDFPHCPGLKLRLCKAEDARIDGLLLVGKSGSGKSSTGNSILRRGMFRAGTSYFQFTKGSQAEERKFDDTLIKVESPRIIDFGEPLQDDALICVTGTFDASS